MYRKIENDSTYLTLLVEDFSYFKEKISKSVTTGNTTTMSKSVSVEEEAYEDVVRRLS